jgi:lipoprotein signal peptidase
VSDVQRRVVMLGIAIALAGVDLLDKALTHAAHQHARSPFVVVLTTFVVIGLVATVPRIASRAALMGVAIAVGGALGNLAAAVFWTSGVPDPLVLAGHSLGIAFNLADVFIFVGDATMISAVLVYALRNRAVLRTSV